MSIFAQTSIEWQKIIGTLNYDNALKIINDEEGNIIFMGIEPHEDLTGNLRNYLIASKVDVEGNEIGKKYYDVAFETYSIPFDYSIGEHFYTESNGQKIINLVINL